MDLPIIVIWVRPFYFRDTGIGSQLDEIQLGKQNSPVRSRVLGPRILFVNIPKREAKLTWVIFSERHEKIFRLYNTCREKQMLYSVDSNVQLICALVSYKNPI